MVITSNNHGVVAVHQILLPAHNKCTSLVEHKEFQESYSEEEKNGLNLHGDVQQEVEDDEI